MVRHSPVPRLRPPAVRRLLGATLLVLIAAASPAGAAPALIPLEPPQDLLELPGEIGYLAPAVAMRPDGGSIAVWVDPEDRVLGRWLGPPEPAGDPEGEVFVIDDTAAAAFEARVVRGDAGYLAAWIRQEGGENVHLAVRAFDGEGQPLGPVVTLVEGAAFFDLAPRPGGGYVVVAEAFAVGELPLQLRFLAADGTPEGEAVPITDPTPGTFESSVQVAVEPGGQVLVSWSENEYATRMASIQVRAFSAEGAPLLPPRQVTAGEFGPDGLDHDLAAAGPEHFLLAWVGDAAEAQAPHVVTALGLDAQGSAGTPHRVDVGEELGRRTGQPRISVAGDGTGVVAWMESDQDQERAVARRVDAGGQPDGDPFVAATVPLPGHLITGVAVDRVPGRTVLGWGTATVTPAPWPSTSAPVGMRLTPPPVIIEPLTSPLQRLRDDVPPLPEEPPLTSAALPGFRTWVLITGLDGEPVVGAPEDPCIPEALCVSGRVPGRSEVFVRIVGPKPNGRLWPTVVKFSTSLVEVWIEQVATGEIEYYRLEGAAPGVDELPGLFDREGFQP